jgi:hypothetical protein
MTNMAKGYYLEGHNAECVDTALPAYIAHIPQNPEVPYCYYKLVTKVIRAVKRNVRTTQFIMFILE